MLFLLIWILTTIHKSGIYPESGLNLITYFFFWIHIHQALAMSIRSDYLPFLRAELLINNSNCHNVCHDFTWLNIGMWTPFIFLSKLTSDLWPPRSWRLKWNLTSTYHFKIWYFKSLQALTFNLGGHLRSKVQGLISLKDFVVKII